MPWTVQKIKNPFPAVWILMLSFIQKPFQCIHSLCRYQYRETFSWLRFHVYEYFFQFHFIFTLNNRILEKTFLLVNNSFQSPYSIHFLFWNTQHIILICLFSVSSSETCWKWTMFLPLNNIWQIGNFGVPRTKYANYFLIE